MKADLKIIDMKISDIKEADYNPRVALKPGDAEWEALKQSIEKYDMVEPVLVNKRNNVCVSGHQRLHVLRSMGRETVPAVLVDLTPEEEKTFNMAINKIKGFWDYDKLKDLIKELDAQGEDLTVTGFDSIELQALMTDYNNIDDLVTDDFSDVGKGAESDTFNMTFTFPGEKEETVKGFISEYGEDYLSNLIIAMSEEAE